MEEKKEKKVKKEAKTVSMPQEKLPYEQLEQIAENLHKQCNALYQKLQEAEKIISNFNDVGMLLAILKESDYFDETFIERCAGKIKEVVSTLLDNSEEKKQEEE